jgi:hypothetical protein
VFRPSCQEAIVQVQRLEELKAQHLAREWRQQERALSLVQARLVAARQ